MTPHVTSILGALLLTGQMANAATLTVGAYGVANHSSCGAGNIPGTIRELDKFFADASFPGIASKNFFWKDSRVRQTEWLKDSDNKASTETVNGFDGADASLLTYIASHGVTSNGLYRALSGSKNSGGCYIPSSGVELGNNSSRYTILSTCQGLKIGNGDNPNSSSGENPSRTWKNGAQGLSCILGYSNNMADKDTYGIYLLQKLKAGDSTLADAFMSASDAVDDGNVPAVLCYGETQEDAAAFIRDNKSFDPTPRSNAASAFVFRQTMRVDGHLKNAKETFPSRVELEPVHVNPARLAKAFIGATNLVGTKGSNGITRYDSDEGSATYNVSTNVLTIKNNISNAEKLGDVPALDEATEIAMNAIQASGLVETVGQLTLAANSEDILSGEDGGQRLLARKLTFKQQLAGFQTLSQAGALSITVGAGGVVSELQASLFKVASVSKAIVSASTVSASSEEHELTAIQRVAEQVPGGAFKVTRVNYGYDAGNFFEVNKSATAVVEVTVEATMGGFSRRYLEKIEL